MPALYVGQNEKASERPTQLGVRAAYTSLIPRVSEYCGLCQKVFGRARDLAWRIVGQCEVVDLFVKSAMADDRKALVVAEGFYPVRGC